MKAIDLIIGQKYIWRRNSKVSHEVTYLGCDNLGKFEMYEFEYIKEGEKVQTLLSVHHVYSDVTTVFDYKEKVKYNILSDIYNNIEKSALNENVDRFELNMQTNSENDTEIFIRRGMSIYSFRVHTIQQGKFYQRWGGGGRLYDKESVIQVIKDIVY